MIKTQNKHGMVLINTINNTEKSWLRRNQTESQRNLWDPRTKVTEESKLEKRFTINIKTPKILFPNTYYLIELNKRLKKKNEKHYQTDHNFKFKYQ